MEAFLASRPRETMFLAGNLARAGLSGGADHPFGGTFLGAFPPSGGALAGVAQLVPMGSLLVAASNRSAVEALAEAAAGCDYQPARVLGMSGEVEDFFASYRQGRPRSVRLAQETKLQELAPDRLEPPDMRGFRAATTDDLELLVPWHRAFMAEELQEDPATLSDEALSRVLASKITEGRKYLLEVEGSPVSTGSLTSLAHQRIQLGGVYTPPGLRGRGHATRLVAAICHFHMAALGALGAVLMVGVENAAARRAYEKVGFRNLGSFRFLHLEEPA